jgi:hypothetical protein
VVGAVIGAVVLVGAVGAGVLGEQGLLEQELKLLKGSRRSRTRSCGSKSYRYRYSRGCRRSCLRWSSTPTMRSRRREEEEQ